MKEPVTLYHYWRSSSSWRVRWALQLKKVAANYVAVNLLDGSSESAEHMKRNPMGFVPVLDSGDRMLIESVAIIEWLEEEIPAPPLYPGGPYERAHIRSLVEIINSGTQPIQNPTVAEKYSDDEKKRAEWNAFFIRRGLTAYQTQCQSHAGKFSVGDTVTAADLYLIPQLYNAERFGVARTEFPLLARIFDNAMKTPEAQASAPDKYKPA